MRVSHRKTIILFGNVTPRIVCLFVCFNGFTTCEIDTVEKRENFSFIVHEKCIVCSRGVGLPSPFRRNYSNTFGSTRPRTILLKRFDARLNNAYLLYMYIYIHTRAHTQVHAKHNEDCIRTFLAPQGSTEPYCFETDHSYLHFRAHAVFSYLLVLVSTGSSRLTYGSPIPALCPSHRHNFRRRAHTRVD